MEFSKILKNVFFFILILQFAPVVLSTIKRSALDILEPRTKVAVITIKNVLMDSSSYITHLNTYFRDKSIKAILIKMECPGGAAGTANAIHDQIKALKAEFPKPVICLVENICASGGYYIASTSDAIIAPATALIGSIGATFPYAFQLKDLMEKWDIGYVPLKSGTYKNAANPFVAMTPEEQALLQGILDDSYRQFSSDVAANRHLSMRDVNNWGNGKIFTASQAHALGLIDVLGSAYAAEKIVREKALIEGKIEWIKPPAQSPLSYLLGGRTPEEDQGMDSDDMATKVGQACASRLLSFVGLPG